MIFKQGHNEKRRYQQPLDDDVISSVTWSISPSGPVLGTPINTDTTTTVRVSGLTAGTDYSLDVHIVATSGDEYDMETPVTLRAT